MINMAWHSSMCYLATPGTEHTNSQKDLPLQHYDLRTMSCVKIYFNSNLFSINLRTFRLFISKSRRIVTVYIKIFTDLPLVSSSPNSEGALSVPGIPLSLVSVVMLLASSAFSR